MQHENFSPQESLDLIQSMILKTKTNISENRFYFLIWGWYAFLAILLQFFLKVVLHYQHHYIVWLGVIPVTIITIWYSKKHHGSNYKTYVGDSMSYLWTGIGISFFVLSFVISNIQKGGWGIAYPFFILFYGLGTFVSGRILQFKPLVIGGIINWILACACVFVSYDYQLLFAAAAILTSYIIPGHLLKNHS
jgi:hypothetical protein